MRLKVKKGSYLDERCNEIPRNSKNPHGNIIDVSIEKTKTCRPDRKIGLCTLNYYTGIDRVYDLVQLALEYKYIIQGGSWYSVVNPATGEVLVDENDSPMKYQGLPKLLAALKANQELLDELDDVLKDEYLEEDNFNEEN